MHAQVGQAEARSLEHELELVAMVVLNGHGLGHDGIGGYRNESNQRERWGGAALTKGSGQEDEVEGVTTKARGGTGCRGVRVGEEEEAEKTTSWRSRSRRPWVLPALGLD